MTLLGPTSNTFISQRLRLHYVDWGNADKPPLLLIHGGRDHCRSWTGPPKPCATTGT
jgi:pimeloyl-ACP methyl ester carboxylesterase